MRLAVEIIFRNNWEHHLEMFHNYSFHTNVDVVDVVQRAVRRLQVAG